MTQSSPPDSVPGGPFALSEQDIDMLIRAASTTRIVSLRVGGFSARLGWFELDAGQCPRQALAAFLRAAAEEIENGP